MGRSASRAATAAAGTVANELKSWRDKPVVCTSYGIPDGGRVHPYRHIVMSKIATAVAVGLMAGLGVGFLLVFILS